MTTDWKTMDYPEEIRPVGTNTVYYFQNGTVTACLADGTECAIPINSWKTRDESPGLGIWFVPLDVPVVIHASYYYKSADGKLDTVAVDQHLTRGYNDW